MEKLDLYSAEKMPLGRTIARGDAIKENEYCLGCTLILKDFSGRILTTQRHPDKTAGLLWEFPGGAVQSGENSLEAIVREMSEEISLDLSGQKLQLLGTVLNSSRQIFMDIYTITLNFEIADLTFQASEIVAGKLAHKEEILRMYQNNCFSVTQRLIAEKFVLDNI